VEAGGPTGLGEQEENHRCSQTQEADGGQSQYEQLRELGGLLRRSRVTQQDGLGPAVVAALAAAGPGRGPYCSEEGEGEQ
jgi:hypothetical protein